MREDLLQPSAPEPSLRLYVDLLKRRKAVVFLTLVLFLGLGALYLTLTPKVYSASAKILVDAPSDSVTRRDTSDPFVDVITPPSNEDVPSQIEVLQSALLIDKVCKVAGVPRDQADFAPARVYDTYIIKLEVKSQKREYAEKLAEVYPKVYLDYVSGNRTGDLTKALDFAKKQLVAEQRLLNRAEQSLERLKNRTGITNVEREQDLALTGSAQVSLDVLRTQVELKGLEGELDSVRRERHITPYLSDGRVTTTNPRIQELKKQLEDLQAEREKELVLYKPEHPRVQVIDKRVAELQRQLSSTPQYVTTETTTVNPAIADLDNKIATLRASVNAKRQQLAQAQRAAGSQSTNVSKFSSFERLQAQYQREIERRRGTVAQLAKSADNLAIREQASRVPVKLLTPASAAKLAWPKTGNIIAGTLILGLFLGVCMALIVDYFDPRMHNWETARRVIDAPVLGFIPVLPMGQRMLRHTTDQKALQSFRLLRTSVQFTALQSGLQSLFFTATQPGEGKSTTSVNYATSLAMDGKRVLIIDVDLQNPNVHRNLDLDRVPGLMEVLNQEIPFEDAIRHTSVEGLHALTCGKTLPNGTELLNSERMRDLLFDTYEKYDVVVIDGPAVLSGADAQIVASLADGVVYVVQPGKVREPSLHYSVHLLRQAKARVVGVVFNRVEDKTMENDFYYGAKSSPYGVFHGLPTWQAPQLPPRRAVVEDPGTPPPGPHEAPAGEANK